MSTSNQSSGGIFLPLLCIAFIVLKLTGYITWGWIWVLAPIWMPLALVLSIIVAIFAFVFILALFTSRNSKVGYFKEVKSYFKSSRFKK